MSTKDKLTASEALYGFCGWLSTRQESIAIGATNDCAILAELIEQFCIENDLELPRDNFQVYLKHPKENT